MSASDPVVIVGMARTPMGAMLGELAGFSANELGAHAIKAAMAEAGVQGEEDRLVYMGNCLPADGPGACAQAGINRGLAEKRRGCDRQQDVRIGHAGGCDGS